MAKAFTVWCEPKANELRSDCKVAATFGLFSTLGGESSEALFQSAKAIWDTGATHSVISVRLAERLGVPRTGKVRVVNANNDAHSFDTCFVNVDLPEGLHCSPLKVSIQKLQEEYDVLIGMDIIGKGDFAVSQRNGQMLFSFRKPSLACLDFTAQPIEANYPGI